MLRRRTSKLMLLLALALAFTAGAYADDAQQLAVQIMQQNGFGFRNDAVVTRRLVRACRKLTNVGARQRPKGATEIAVAITIEALGGEPAGAGISCFASLVPE